MKKIGTLITAAVIATSVGFIASPSSAAPAECPGGGWVIQLVTADTLFDDNGDGRICTKDIPGDGDGNSANSQRDTGQPSGHIDGHNHKDNNI